MAQGHSRVKLLVAGRRKPGMTRREHADHRYNVHAAVTAAGDKSLIPIEYTQNHIIDIALGVPTGTPNLNHRWLIGAHEIAECDFRDSQQLRAYFGSDHVRDEVAPDIPTFADYGCLVWSVGKSARQLTAKSNRDPYNLGFNAFYFLAAPAGANDPPAEVLDKIAAALLDNKMEGVVAGELFTVVPEPELAAYFGNNDEEIPVYSVVLKLDLDSRLAFRKVRDVQLKLENESWLQKEFDLSKSFISLTKGLVVFSTHKEFDPKAKPDYDEVF